MSEKSRGQFNAKKIKTDRQTGRIVAQDSRVKSLVQASTLETWLNFRHKSTSALATTGSKSVLLVTQTNCNSVITFKCSPHRGPSRLTCSCLACRKSHVKQDSEKEKETHLNSQPKAYPPQNPLRYIIADTSILMPGVLG